MQIQIDTAMLKAVALGQGDRDIRYYLNGVLVEVVGGKSWLVATDGHRMHVGKGADCPDIPDLQIIIPTETIKGALTGEKRPTILLEKNDLGGQFTLGLQIFTPVDGRFPEWRRVVPTVDTPQPLPPVCAHYLADAGKAAKLLGDKQSGIFVHADAHGAMLVKLHTRLDFFAVVMAQRKTKKIAESPTHAWHTAERGSKPDWI